MIVRGRTPNRLTTTAILSIVTVTFFTQTQAASTADFELGRYLAAECMTCHRAATSTSTIPNIFGLDEAHLSEVLRAYRAKDLPNPVMQNIAGALNDEEISALATFFAKTRKPW
ncbi:MAG: hypothetical protein F9K38_02590 [Pseudorhodoplanes sp.]|nr:MAG: hypothetical protein F9K38_02590 [Pseudorhodoplanes sp.]